MHQRISVTLPEETLKLIDQLTKRGDRSRFIDRAVKHYVKAVSQTNLRKLLEAGAIARAERDLTIAEE